jgi:drug/metabolite transporter (DMT)-like permease
MAERSGGTRTYLWLGLTTLYLAWGSTYLAIRVMVETMPPLLATGARFLAAGGLLVGALALLGGLRRIRFRGSELFGALVLGALILVGGIGLLTVAEETVPSGLSALVVASVPLWVVVLRLLLRERVSPATLVGVAVGFAGVALLMAPGGRPQGAPLTGLLILFAAAASTAAGAVATPRLPLPADALLATALEMVAAGALLVIVGAIAGETGELDLDQFSARSLLAFAYLVGVGSILAYTAFVWLLQNAPVSLVATYAYVNPAVAVFLGWVVLSEEITLTMLAGAVVIVGSVAFVVRRGERSDDVDGTSQTVR